MRRWLDILSEGIASERPARPWAAWMLVALCLPGVVRAAEGDRPSVTLGQAVERALRQDPRVIQSQGQRRVAAAAERSARGAFLPSLTASASSSLAGAAEVGVRPGAGAGISASWDVFTGFRRGARQAQARSEAESAEASWVQSRAGVALEVERTFYEGLRARELEEVAQSRLRRAEAGLEAATRKATAGAGTRSDVLRAELELNTARQALLEARTQREAVAFALGRLIGADGPVDARADAAVEGTEPDPDPEAFVAEVLQGAPEVRVAEAGLESAQAGVQVARSAYFPQVQLGAGYDLGLVQDEQLLAGQTGWSVRLGLSFPIFDGFRREEVAERARVQETVASAYLADTRRAVRAGAEQLLGALRLARERISLTEKAVAVAAEDLRVQQERYQMGVTTMLDLLTSQISVVEAETNLVAARFDYRLARAELQALAGRHR